jgi:hypothetical protein
MPYALGTAPTPATSLSPAVASRRGQEERLLHCRPPSRSTTCSTRSSKRAPSTSTSSASSRSSALPQSLRLQQGLRKRRRQRQRRRRRLPLRLQLRLPLCPPLLRTCWLPHSPTSTGVIYDIQESAIEYVDLVFGGGDHPTPGKHTSPRLLAGQSPDRSLGVRTGAGSPLHSSECRLATCLSSRYLRHRPVGSTLSRPAGQPFLRGHVCDSISRMCDTSPQRHW